MSTLSSPSPYPPEPPAGVTVIIPAYNEEQAIGSVIAEILKQLALPSIEFPPPLSEILVVDDGSSDATAEAARQTSARVICHRENLGYGAALKTGLRAATYNTIIITDADGTYPAESIAGLLEQLTEYDMVVGSRVGDNVHIPAERRPAKWLLRITAEFLAGRKIPDLNSGLRAFRRSDALRFLSLYPSGFSFTTTITLAYLSSDLRVQYVPINYYPRTGRSKLRPIRDTKNLFLTVVRCILFFNPLRVTLPAAGFLALIALAIAVFIRDSQGRLLDGTITILVTCALQIVIVGFLADMLSRMRR